MKRLRLLYYSIAILFLAVLTWGASTYCAGVSAKVVNGDTQLTLQYISAGVDHACAIASDDKAYCWGDGADGRLGSGSTSDRNTPVAVVQGAMPSGATIKQMAAGNSTVCAIASDDKAYC